MKDWKWIAAACLAIILCLFPCVANAGRAYFILDARNGRVLASQNADVRNHPASLTKMMTLYLTFEAIHQGRFKWSSPVPFSTHAASMSPTKLWVKAGSSVSVKEAVLGMIVPSANDAAAAMAEKLGGSEAKFALLMNAKARALGMTRTRFYNASGLPDRRQVTTARDMSTLAVALMNDFPSEYRLFATRSFRFRGRTVQGHNHLMYRYQGMDGFKTGFTNASGFNLVSAVRRRGKRVIGVVMGGATARSRDGLMEKLMDQFIAKAESRSTNRLLASVSDHPTPKGVALGMPLPKARPHGKVLVASAFSTATDIIKTSASYPAPKPPTWAIQIAALPSPKAARDMLADLKNRYAALLKPAQSSVETYQHEKEAVYRARFNGYSSREEAAHACERLRTRNVDCFVPRL